MLINSLGLKNFKCFEELDVKFAPITLLTGANSSGKSSLINAILAVLQTEQFPLYLSPNGKYVNLGSFEEMISWNKANTEQTFSINISLHQQVDKVEKYNTTWKMNIKNSLPELCSLNTEERQDDFNITSNSKNEYLFSGKVFLFDEDKNDYLKTEFGEDKIEFESKKPFNFVYLKEISFSSFEEMVQKIGRTFYLPDLFEYYYEINHNYIGSFRLPPERTYYQKPKANDKVDVSGEGYIDQIIEWEETDTDKLNRLIQTMFEMELFKDIVPNRLKGGRFELNIKVNENSNAVSLTDVGFGISQFLPIIVADLQLSEKSLLAISQPEIHLHPKIQATFSNYLANQVKQTEKQYIVETHSEYLLNRIRLLLVTGELKPEDVRVLYFENDGIKSTVYDVEFATDGQIKGAPQGFFDTYGIDVMDIAMNAH